MERVVYKNKYRISSARLENWDYSTPAYYFVTICTKNRGKVFGEILKGDMNLNRFGKIVEKCWNDLPEYYKNIELDLFQLMTDHVHFIVRLKHEQECRDAIHRISESDIGAIANEDAMNRVSTISNNPMLKHGSLPNLIRYFKAKSTHSIRKFSQTFAWQPSYYDHVIQSEKELYYIREYITNNPLAGESDIQNLFNKQKSPVRVIQ